MKKEVKDNYKLSNIKTMQDLHIHTIFSDGKATIDSICQQNLAYGLEIGISDHILCKKLPNKADVIKYFDTLSRYPVFKGGEIDLGETGIIDDLIVSKADYIIGSIHSINVNNQLIKLGKYFDFRAQNKTLHPKFIFDDYLCCKALEEILNTVRKELRTNPITILGHCTVTPFYEQVNLKFRNEWENEIISLCKTSETAIEVSGLWIEPNLDFITRVLNEKVKITYGSDCHDDYSRKYFDYYDFVLQQIDINKGDVLKIVK